MFLIIFLMLAMLCLIAKKRRAEKPGRRAALERARLDLILQNVEAYDGSGKGQKRLEDNK